MNTRSLHLALGALLLGGAALPAVAASSASSEVSDSLSTSVGSISTSVGKSSDSSKGKKDVAQGDYRVVEMAAVDATAGRPAMLRLKLQAVADASADGELLLTLPQAAAERGQLAPGAVVVAKARPYGVEFSAAITQQAFFLALRDEWYREIDSKAVVL